MVARGLALESFGPFPTLLGSEAQPSPAQGRSCDLGLCTVGAPLPLHSAVHSGEPPGAEGRGPPGPAIWKPLDRAPVEGGLSPHPCLVPERVVPHATGFQATSTAGDCRANGCCGRAGAHAALKLKLLARLLGWSSCPGLDPRAISLAKLPVLAVIPLPCLSSPHVEMEATLHPTALQGGVTTFRRRLAWASTETQEEGEGGGKLEPARLQQTICTTECCLALGRSQPWNGNNFHTHGTAEKNK